MLFSGSKTPFVAPATIAFPKFTTRLTLLRAFNNRLSFGGSIPRERAKDSNPSLVERSKETLGILPPLCVVVVPNNRAILYCTLKNFLVSDSGLAGGAMLRVSPGNG